MLYLTTDKGSRIIVLEAGNLQELQKGRPAMTPDGEILIAFTPDPVWLADQILDSGGDLETITKAIFEAAKRPQKPMSRPYHEPHKINLRPKQ